MGLVLTTIAGLIVWIVLWAIDVKSFDAFLLTLGMVILAATARMIMPYLPGNRPDRSARLSWSARTHGYGRMDCSLDRPSLHRIAAANPQ